ncbi:MAG: hypothetical protein LUE29_08525 [Lachnospiraceae bacterium]|nr:hypothetical protein [Lachnospiraceae bacterium]
MTKKLAAFALTAVLVLGSVLPCFAAGSSPNVSTTVTATDEATGEELYVFDSASEGALSELDGYLVVETTTVSEEDEADIVDTAASLSGLDTDAITVGAVFEVTWVGDTTEQPDSITFTVPVSSVTSDNLIVVLFQAEDGTWQEMNATVSTDGTVTVTGVTSMGLFAYVLEVTSSTEGETTTATGESDTTTASGSEATTTASGGTSQETGDISIALPIALLVVAAVAIVILVARGKKEEN